MTHPSKKMNRFTLFTFVLVCMYFNQNAVADHHNSAGSQAPVLNTKPGTHPMPKDQGALGMALVWIKDWDRMREYEESIVYLMEEYGIKLLHRGVAFPNNQEIPEYGKPDRIDTFYVADPQNLQKIFQDPRLQERLQWRNQHATERVMFFMGASVTPVEAKDIGWVH